MGWKDEPNIQTYNSSGTCTLKVTELNIHSSAWAGNQDKIVPAFCFGKDLVHVGAQHIETDNDQVDTR